MINLDNRSGQPIYHQIKENYKRLILSGAISENEWLPSVRELASKLAINPNTIQRAYRELEIEGYVGTTPGKGVFAIGGDTLKKHRIDEIYNSVLSEIHKLLELGINKDDIIRQISCKLEEKR